MARELGLNPRKLGDLVAVGQGARKLSLPESIEKLYQNKFKRSRPVRVVPLEQPAGQTTAVSARVEQALRVSPPPLLPARNGPPKAELTEPRPESAPDDRGRMEEFRDIEFHRNGIALLSHTSLEVRGPLGVAFVVPGNADKPEQRSCTCQSRARPCPHLRRASGIQLALAQVFDGAGPDGAFRASFWFRILGPLIDASTVDASAVVLAAPAASKTGAICVLDAKGSELVTYPSTGPDAARFLERLRPSGNPDAPTRADALAELIARTRTSAEQQMQLHGARTRRQAAEESFWFRLAYHAFREFGGAPCVELAPVVNLESGAFTVAVQWRDSPNDLFRFTVPGQQVRPFLTAAGDAIGERHRIPVHPIPAQSVLKAEKDLASGAVEVEPTLRIIRTTGEEHYVSRRRVERYRYGDLAYIPDLGILVQVDEGPALPSRYRGPTPTTLVPSEIPAFLEELAGIHEKDASAPPPVLMGIDTIRRFERVSLSVEALDRDWFWLAVEYGAGSLRLSLTELLAARRRGDRFLATEAGWVDTQAPELAPLAALAEGASPSDAVESSQRGLKISKRDLLRFRATINADIALSESRCQAGTSAVARLLELRPARALEPLHGLTSTLRDYQVLGVSWLLFLHDNGLGGLLCDDMGLGKTHQTLALFAALREQRGETEPCLVVCPATVLPHWERLIRLHAPSLRTARFHGDKRDLERAVAEHEVVLTSYGVLRNDIDTLSKAFFAVVVFDEIQVLKNADTQAHTAARKLSARTLIGLTGTPVENHPNDLWALFDVVLPGYLGTLAEFQRRHDTSTAPARATDEQSRTPLQKLVSPFTLRRRKEAVLTELPSKIEDTRFCRLSEDQVKLYRDAVRTRGASLVPVLEDESRPIPYVHIFTLLDRLKRICAHPALVAAPDCELDSLTSGKWDLFREILDESLGSQQKVVVFSQFLDMIRIIERHLQREGVGHVVLTGQSRDRGEIVRRFQEEADCRVFVGSLKAGGVGIDLVAASVVIHYDRWWNAAKEDQATDRVHRMGQQRGVQVFKLIAEGTLEEKIAALIEKKRALAEQLIEEDSPNVLKTFDRSELLELLRMEVAT